MPIIRWRKINIKTFSCDEQIQVYPKLVQTVNTDPESISTTRMDMFHLVCQVKWFYPKANWFIWGDTFKPCPHHGYRGRGGHSTAHRSVTVNQSINTLRKSLSLNWHFCSTTWHPHYTCNDSFNEHRFAVPCSWENVIFTILTCGTERKNRGEKKKSKFQVLTYITLSISFALLVYHCV